MNGRELVGVLGVPGIRGVSLRGFFPKTRYRGRNPFTL